MTDGPRQTHRLVTEILTVLERHGHHAHDHEHTDQAVAMITDLVGIYDGTQRRPCQHRPPRRTEALPRASPSVTLSSSPVPTSAPSSPPSSWPPSTSGTSSRPAPGCDDQSCNVCRARLRRRAGLRPPSRPPPPAPPGRPASRSQPA